jgi:hypothetical protein
MSPTKAQQTMTYAPPLLRLAASPHDSHLLATFAADSNLIRILDVRQPGQALLELRGHSSAVNSIEWNPSRRGMLASGGDDSLVLVWDLLHANNGATISQEHAAPPQPPVTAPTTGGGAGTQNTPKWATSAGRRKARSQGRAASGLVLPADAVSGASSYRVTNTQGTVRGSAHKHFLGGQGQCVRLTGFWAGLAVSKQREKIR